MLLDMSMGTVNLLPYRSVHSMIMQIPMILVAMLVMSASVSGRFVVERNSLVVTSPPFLRGRHDTAVANFGIPQYGGRMAGSIIYPKRNGNGCKDFDTSFRGKAGSFPTFLLLDRGGSIPFFLSSTSPLFCQGLIAITVSNHICIYIPHIEIKHDSKGFDL